MSELFFREEDTSAASLEDFYTRIMAFYAASGRHFPWRERRNPYIIILSEMMLQQTQTERVLPKYEAFLALWPDMESFKQDATLPEVLTLWSGLGYNRRAKYLFDTLKSLDVTKVTEEQYLRTLPGVGPSTAAAVLAFACNQKAVYLETNVRRVLLTVFFAEEENVPDGALKEILISLYPYVEDFALWYYALMDYGVFLARHLVNANRRSRHYQVQSRFCGSFRQIRGALLSAITQKGALTHDEAVALGYDGAAVDKALKALEKDALITFSEGCWHLPGEER